MNAQPQASSCVVFPGIYVTDLTYAANLPISPTGDD
jgi:hypothetical protein